MGTVQNEGKEQAKAKKTCVTPEFRVSFPNVFRAKSMNDDSKPKFSIVMLFDKKTDLKELKRAVHFAATEKWGSDKTKWPKKLKMPFRDGDVDKPDVPGYKNAIFVGASASEGYPPGVVDQRRQPIVNEADFYAGCFARAQLYAYTYEVKGNVGVTFGLNHIQKIKDGEKFSGRQNAEDVFEDVEDFEDGLAEGTDEENYGF
jgi:hypothetical protein